MTDGADRASADDTDDSDGYVHTPGAVEDGTADNRGYVHTPEGVEQKEPKQESPDTTATTDPDDNSAADLQATATDDGVVHPDAVEREFDWRGWILVGVLFVAFVVAPLTIYLIPPGAEHYFTVLIVMPLIPALLLAVVAVWATTRP